MMQLQSLIYARDESVFRFMRLFILFVFTLSLAACGAESSDGYTPTKDTVTTSGLVTFDAKAIRIVTKGPTVQSELIEECSIGFEQEDLTYVLNGPDELILDGQKFQYLRPLSTPSMADNVDARLFAVWSLPPETLRQVTYTFEVEIRSDTIIYRNNCVR